MVSFGMPLSYSAAAWPVSLYWLDAPLQLRPEVPDQALDRPGRRVAEGADRVALDLIGHVQQHVDLLQLRLALDHAVSTRHIQPVPSRQGVHWPQLSCM